MKDYPGFTVEDFIMDEDFIRWVLEKKPGDDAFWERWLHQHPEKRPVITEARRIIESMEIEQHFVSRKVIQHETEKLLKTIGRRSLEPALNRPVRFLNRKW